MQISPQKNSGGQTFQEFSEQKFSELKKIFPKKSDHQINTMIKNEWESTNKKTTNQKKMRSQSSLQNRYQDLPHVSQISSHQQQSITPMRLDAHYGSKSSERLRSLELNKPSQEISQEVSDEVQEQNERELASISQKKGRKIIKKDKKEQGDSEYIKFYKHYYESLKRQHSKWTNEQITIIIKLLWRKKKTFEFQKKFPVSFKAFSGQKCMNKHLTEQGKIAERELWNRLPSESKRYWKMKGKGVNIFADSRSKKLEKIILAPTKSFRIQQNEPQINKNFSFMNKTI